MLEKALKENDTSLKAELKGNKEKDLLDRFNFYQLTDLYAAIGLGELSIHTILSYLNIRQDKEEESLRSNVINKEVTETPPKRTSVHESGVVVEGVDNLMIRLSRCCNPVPGDEIIGYITRGRGISVHRKDCANLRSEPDLNHRTIDVHWESDNQLGDDYETEVEVIGFDRAGLFNDVLHVVNHTVKNLKRINGKINDESIATITLRLMISNTRQLDDLMVKLKNVPEVYEVKRKI